MKVIILAGGSGNRLWPLSREEKPKQFLLLNDSSSLLQKTIKRLLTFVKTEDLLIVTNKKYHDLVIDQLDIIDKKLSSRILIEKEKKNTAPSIILAIKYFIEIEKTSLDEAILVSPCDHYISSEDLFQKSIEIACEIKNPKKIIVFGAIPTRPETGYGYIEKEEGQVDKNIFDVRRFVEKPSLDLAQKYYANKNYLWNCGFFLFSICSFIKEIKEHSEELSPFLSFSYQKIQSEFSSFINISIDYALIEKTKNLQVVPLLCDWSDMGSWDNIYEMFPKDLNNNVKNGEVVDFDTSNCLLMSDKRLLVTIGLKNIVVVSTDDSVFLAHRGKSELVKHLSKKLKDRKQISDPKEKKYSWGKSFVIEDTNGYRLTKLSIKPKNELKMLKEEVASKELLILKGNVKVKTNEKEIILNENQRFFPDKQEYSLLNIGDEYLEILDIEFYISKKKILEKIIKKRDYTPINKN